MSGEKKMPRAARVLLVAGLLAGCGSVTDGGEDGPVAESLSPDVGGSRGGTEVTVTGSGFLTEGEDETSVLVGDRLAAEVEVTDDTTLTFVTPPGEPDRSVDVTIFNDGGFAILPGGFSYGPLVELESVSPNHANIGGGDSVTITGRRFMENSAREPTVTFGSAEAREVQVVSDTELTVTVPASGAAPFAPVDVAVENGNGRATLPETFRYTKQGFLLTERPLTAPQRLLFLDPETMETTKVSDLSIPVSKMTLDPTGALFGVSSPRAFPSRLVTIDPLSGEIDLGEQLADPDGDPVRIVSIVFIGSQLFGFGRNSGDHLVGEINADTGEVTFNGATPLTTSQADCIAARDSQSLHFIDQFDENLQELSVADSTTAAGPALNGPSSPCHALVEVDGTFFGLARIDSEVLTVDISTGAVTVLTQIPFAVSSLAPTPDDF